MDAEVTWPVPDTQDVWQRMWRAYDGACNPASFANLDRRFHYARGVSWALDKRASSIAAAGAPWSGEFRGR